MKKHRPKARRPKRRTTAQNGLTVPPIIEGVYYHGGTAYMKVGDYVLPRSVTGLAALRDSMSFERQVAFIGEDLQIFEDGEWAFITENFKLAAYYAVRCELRQKRGWVYRVEPEGEIEIDPDRVIDCFRCSRARIIAVEKIPFALTQKIKSKMLPIADSFHQNACTDRILQIWNDLIG